MPRGEAFDDNGVDGRERGSDGVVVIHHANYKGGSLEATVGACPESEFKLVDRKDCGVDFGGDNVLVVAVQAVGACRPGQTAETGMDISILDIVGDVGNCVVVARIRDAAPAFGETGIELVARGILLKALPPRRILDCATGSAEVGRNGGAGVGAKQDVVAPFAANTAYNSGVYHRSVEASNKEVGCVKVAVFGNGVVATQDGQDDANIVGAVVPVEINAVGSTQGLIDGDIGRMRAARYVINGYVVDIRTAVNAVGRQESNMTVAQSVELFGAEVAVGGQDVKGKFDLFPHTNMCCDDGIYGVESRYVVSIGHNSHNKRMVACDGIACISLTINLESGLQRVDGCIHLRHSDIAVALGVGEEVEHRLVTSNAPRIDIGYVVAQ